MGGNFNQLLGTRVLLGIAECILNVVCFPYVSDLYPASSRSMAIQVIFQVIEAAQTLQFRSFAQQHRLARVLGTYSVAGQQFTLVGGSTRFV